MTSRGKRAGEIAGESVRARGESSRIRRLAIAVALVGLLAGGLVASCKQGEGERCQVDDDCEDPLVCAQATQTCADNNTSSGIDALPPVDAPDAPPDT